MKMEGGSRALRLASAIGCLRFLVVQLERPAPRVISQPSCVAKCATSPVCLMPVRATRTLSLFLLSSSSSQPLESLQRYQQRQRTPLLVTLPALVAATRLPPLYLLSSSSAQLLGS